MSLLPFRVSPLRTLRQSFSQMLDQPTNRHPGVLLANCRVASSEFRSWALRSVSVIRYLADRGEASYRVHPVSNDETYQRQHGITRIQFTETSRTFKNTFTRNYVSVRYREV